ncbi:hypothetical protein C8F04DRAFT_1310168 [Mycena alexandri]|uniref:Uncharacterized protein n=1 Tax=Mycena alexandri TaxID=1745969 RepID=A0AAD6S7K7_9AGAR|nr:hypothetical protein C8F04DRAFT_1310168 [Mycena alexandri]
MEGLYSIPSFSGEDDSWNWPAFDTGSDASSSGMYAMGSNSNAASIRHPNFYPVQQQQNLQYQQQYQIPSRNEAQAISMASHADLVMANNTTYIDLLQRYSALTEQHRRLQLSVTQQPSQPASSPSLLSHHSAATSLPSSSPLFTLPGATDLADQKDFPLVRWWDRTSYTKSQSTKKTTTMNSESGKRGGARAAKDINVMHQYLETEDSKSVSGLTAKAMRTHQRTIFREIRKRAPEELPATWGNASLSVVNYHRAEMYKAHPLLRLCQSHWKVDLMATSAYSSWYLKNVKNKQRDSQSDSDSDDNSDQEPSASSVVASSSASTSSSSASGAPLTRTKGPQKRTKHFAPSQQPKKLKPTPPSSSDIPSPSSDAATPSPDPSFDSPSTESSALSPSLSSVSAPSTELPPPGRRFLPEAPAETPTDTAPPNTSISSATTTTTVIVSPIDEEFGPASGPTQRSDAVDAGTTSKSRKANKQAKKRATKSLTTDPPVTPDEFKTLFSQLSPVELKVWTTKSAEQNSAKKNSKAQTIAAAEGVASGSSSDYSAVCHLLDWTCATWAAEMGVIDQLKRRTMDGDQAPSKSQSYNSGTRTFNISDEPANIQQSFSSAKHPTVWRTLPLLEALAETWANMAATEKFAPMRDSINAGLENLEKWYGKTDDTNVYFVCLALDPNFKTAYAEESWNSAAFEEGTTKFESVFDAYYVAPVADAEVAEVPEVNRVPTAPVQYGHSWMRTKVQARKNKDFAAVSPHDELRAYLNAPLSLTPEMFEALQLLKSAYRNGHMNAAEEATKRVVAVLDAALLVDSDV